jgi:membrane-anchored protein YejM (alkaline phosphatase superfamily)
MPDDPKRTRTLAGYALLTYLALLVNGAGYLREIEYVGRITPLFVGAVFLTYFLLYLLPACGVVFLVNGVLNAPPLARRLDARPRLRTGIVYTTAVTLFSLLHVVIFADKFIYRMYGFHLNGFVWNLVFTRGGMESLGGSNSTFATFAAIIAGFVVLQIALLMAVLRFRRVQRFVTLALRRRAVIATTILIVMAGVFERVTYGVSHLRSYGPVLAASSSFPFYIPTTFNSLAKRWGIEPAREPSMRVNVESMALRYPLKPLKIEPPERPLNLVWLVSESLRYDMVDPEIMPFTHAFAQRSAWFHEHYSGGNGTRMGLFSMFYGLYGSYWFPFLADNRGPALMDVIIDAGYQMKMFTSARFTYPEFDRTIFARVPGKLLHEGDAQPKWRRDRENVDLILKFIAERDPARPFMTFMFFDGPHANYYFPKENIIRTPYAEDLNYATMDLEKDIELIKNRYINACNHLDGQIRRVVEYLEEKQLLDSTIVIITGDHGEEFMEKGRWGHNSEFHDEQVRPPLVLWVPGREPVQVRHMTSHLDLPATLMPLLGVKNPPEEYSLGRDLFSPTGREYTVIAGWDDVAYVSPDYKAVFPLKGYNLHRQKVTTRDDAPVQDRAAFYRDHTQKIVQVMKEMTRFSR